MKNKLKNKYIFIPLGILIVLMFFLGGVYAATKIAGSSVTYSNSSSGLLATTVQAAIDELYTQTDIRKMGNFIGVYKYSTATSTKCITGIESTCVKSTCYKTKTSGSCPAGTIIKYKVNDSDIVTFHVMYDTGTTMTMQSQRNTIYSTAWINAADYVAANTDSTACGYTSCNDEGPRTILTALENATSSWSNVNNITYTAGTTIFKTSAYTGCSSYNSCTKNVYTLQSKTVKARILTIQEAKNLGCTSGENTCPSWMTNYLTIGVTGNYGYWTMTAQSLYPHDAWFINYNGQVFNGNVFSDVYYGARAVVVVSK